MTHRNSSSRITRINYDVHTAREWRLHQPNERPVILNGTLSEIFGLDSISQPNRKHHDFEHIHFTLESHSGFISAYRVWEFDKSNPDYLRRLVDSLAFIPFIMNRLVSVFNIEPGGFDRVTNGLLEHAKEHPEELKQVHDILLSVIDDGTPKILIYKVLVHAYVEILRDCERAANTGLILSRYMKPYFADDSFIQKRDVVRMLRDVPEEELQGANSGFLGELKSGGITIHEVEQYKQLVDQKNRARNTFHKEILEYAKGLNLTEFDVMADIVFMHRNRTCFTSIKTGKLEIELSGGVLMLGSPDIVLPETSLQVDESASGHLLEEIARYRKLAQEVLEARNDPNTFLWRTYKSHINYNNTEEQDLRTLEKVKQDNPDISITYGFEPSHYKHGPGFIYFLCLRIQLQEIFEKHPNPDGRLEKLMAYINTTIGQRF